MNAWILVDSDGRMVRVHQDGLDVRVQVGDQEARLDHAQRVELARFLLSGISDIAPVVETLARNEHLFEPLPEPEPEPARKPAHVTEGHAFYGRPADPVNIEAEVKLPPLQPKTLGRTVVVDDEGLPAPPAKKPAPKERKTTVEAEAILPPLATPQVKEDPSSHERRA